MFEQGIIIPHKYTGLICKCKADTKFKPKKSYVYVVVYKSEIVYIGKGNKGRWKHSNNGKGNPASVLVACLTLGFLPQILLLLGIIWLVTSIPIWLWVIMGILAFMIFVYVAFFKEDSNEKQE